MRLQVQSLASFSGLRIRHCRELWGRSQMWLTKGHTLYNSIYEKSRIGKPIELERMLVVTKEGREGETRSNCLTGTGLSLGVMKMFWN